LGILLTFISIKKESTKDANGYEDRHIHPATPVLCPSFGCALGVGPTPQPNPDPVNTYYGAHFWNVFFEEFMASFCFIFIWLIIRNYDVGGPLAKV